MNIEVKQIGRVGYRIPVNNETFVRGITNEQWGEYNGPKGGAPDVNLRAFHAEQSPPPSYGY